MIKYWNTQIVIYYESDYRKYFLHLGLCDKLSDSNLVEWRNTKGDSIKIDISEGKQ